jgi:hypothetical protein
MSRWVLMFNFLLVVGCIAHTPFVYGQASDDKTGVEFFERKIRPLLAERCYECHSGQGKPIQGGLRLDSRAAIVQGGDSGPSIEAGKPEKSLLVTAVGYEGDTQMPPKGKLPVEEIKLLTEWVRRGAPMPADGSGTLAKAGIDFAKGRQFWSFQTPRHIDLPATENPGIRKRPIDALILSALKKQSLEPSPVASRRTLIRRATFDLLGLPPTPEEIEQFENDPSPNAYEQLIERLLASPHYGERWARYWLDLARYSDKTPSWQGSTAEAWLYRDWVVKAFNEDLPYDQFVCRQLAVDQMPESRLEDRAALGFLGLSPVYWKELKLDKEVIKGTVAEEWEERIDAIGRTFLGLSLACARCHDHKFDPVSAEDYYALAGVLASTRITDLPTIPDAEAEAVREARKKVQALQQESKKLSAANPVSPESQAKIEELQRQAAELERTTPHYQAPQARAVDDAALYVLANGADATKLEYKPGEAIDLQVQIRGNPSKLGPLVPRRFLTVLCKEPPKPFTRGSGRLELAEAIVREGAPLSARVIVNRIWKYHFGRGLVETTSDFGSQGARPSHPELLDDLTARFIDQGWSIKWLHREIMLSATFQQASSQDAAKFAIDPENRWLWRMNRRRLDIEAWRDAMLSVTGQLDRQVGGRSVNLTDLANRRRTIYGSIDREDPDDMLRLHDFPDAATHSPSREPTTTALQQLFVLNSPFVQQQATKLAQRVTTEHPGSVDPQIRRAYLLLFGRPATEVQVQLGRSYLAGGKPDQPPTIAAWQQYAQVLLGTNEFLFVD